MTRSRVLSAARWASLVLISVWSGCQHLDREKTYPIGIYGVRTTNDQAVAHEAGFSLIVGPADKTYLDTAHRLGLKVLAFPGTSAGDKFSADRARAVATRFDHHPALWAWYLVDEPDLHGVPPQDVLAVHRFLKREGVTKPTVVGLFQGGEALEYADVADIMMIDRYPVPWLPLANFPQHVRLARFAAGRKKPLLAVVQAFDWSYYPHLLPGRSNLRPPTEEEIRCMTYCALVRKASGLFYYCFNDGSWNIQNHPAVWESLQRVVAEVRDRQPLFQAKHVWWACVQEFPGSTNGFNAALESSVSPALLRVTKGNASVPAGLYLVAVNNTERLLAYRVTVPPLRNEHVLVLDENRSVPIVDGWLEDQFAPYALHVYGPLR